jgi:hypothetical protein
MNTITIQTSTIKSLADAFKAEGKALSTLAKAYDTLYADGVRSSHLVKNQPEFNADVFTQVQAAIIAGKLEKADLALFNMTPEQAKAKGASAMRNKVTSAVSKYIGNVRRALDQRDPVKQEEAAKAAEKAQKAKKATSEHGEQVDDKKPETEAHASQVGTVNPRASREAYCEAINLMIMATNTHADKLISKNAARYNAALAAILSELIAH